jgi:DNA-binding MarR family transcriptional regulator
MADSKSDARKQRSLRKSSRDVAQGMAPAPATLAARGSQLESMIGYLLRCAENVAASKYYEYAGEKDVTHRQFAVLAMLERHGRLTQTELAQLIRIDRSTINEMMPRLEERGLVKRESSRVDKRAVDVELTPSGRRIFQDMLPAALASSEAVLAVLPAEYRVIFRHCLEMIVSSDGRKLEQDN